MRNRTVTFQKKVALVFAIGLPVNETQFSKLAITETFFSQG